MKNMERRAMYRLLKFIHILGLTLFLGSIFGHIVAGVLGGAPDSATFVFARQEVATATWALTLPGLALCVFSGIGMMAVSGQSPVKTRWLAIHAGFTVAVVAIAALAIVPTLQDILQEAIVLQKGLSGGSMETIMAKKRIEDIAGSINVLLTLAIIFLGVWKPKL
jgi:hypothetical protein